MVTTREVGHGSDAGASPAPAGQIFDVRKVVAIHCHDQIEAVQILRLQLASPAGQLEPAAGGGVAHAGIGQASHMPTTGSCRVHLKVMTPALLLYEVKEHGFGSRGPTNVA
jgi:hypothetical protein